MLDCCNPIVFPPEPDARGKSCDGVAPARASHGDAFEQWFGPGEKEHWSAAVAAPVPCRVARQSSASHEGAVARNIYVVQAGDFKVSKAGEDGYEQVLDFATAGDVLGLEALAGGRCLATAEAMQDSLLYAVPIQDLRALRAANPTFDERLQEALSAQWSRMRDMAWLTGAVGSDRRTARFLLLLARRMAERGRSASRLHLPMRRRDIASYLGLAHESISRSMTALAANGMLNVLGREIEIVDAAGLSKLASNTRGHGAEPMSVPLLSIRPHAEASCEMRAH